MEVMHNEEQVQTDLLDLKLLKREPVDESDVFDVTDSDAVGMCDVIVTNVVQCEEEGLF